MKLVEMHNTTLTGMRVIMLSTANACLPVPAVQADMAQRHRTMTNSTIHYTISVLWPARFPSQLCLTGISNAEVSHQLVKPSTLT